MREEDVCVSSVDIAGLVWVGERDDGVADKLGEVGCRRAVITGWECDRFSWEDGGVLISGLGEFWDGEMGDKGGVARLDGGTSS